MLQQELLAGVDALRVYELQYRNLNNDYLKHWIKELDLHEQWSELVSNAEPLL